MRKLVRKGPSFREAMSVNWNKCKAEIEIGLDSSVERIVSKRITSKNTESNDGRVSLIEKKDSPRSWQ